MLANVDPSMNSVAVWLFPMRIPSQVFPSASSIKDVIKVDKESGRPAALALRAWQVAVRSHSDVHRNRVKVGMQCGVHVGSIDGSSPVMKDCPCNDRFA